MRRRPLAGAALALVLAAGCTGGDGGGDRADDTTTSSTESSTTTTTEAVLGADDVEVADDPEEGFFFEEFAFGGSVATGEVVEPRVYRVVQKAGGFRFERLVVGANAYTREGSDATFASIPFVIGPTSDVSALAQLDEGVGDDFGGTFPDQLAIGAAVESAEVTPADFVRALDAVEVEARDGGGLLVEGDVPIDPRALDAIEGAGFDVPAIRARALLDADGVVREIDLSIAFSFGQGVQLRIEYSYGRTAVVVEPTADEIDRTPNVAEEALRAYTDTPIVAPAVVPAGLELDVADLLSPAETLEGCTQVSLDYEPAPDGGVDFLQLFVVPRECAEAFDPTPYDETFGGLPSRRVQLLEVLVGDSVVQLDSSLADADLEAIVRTLTPLTADEVIAMVAPS